MTTDYLFYGFDTRAYVPLGRTTLAFRLASDVSHGKIPLYDRLYIGYNERVRGHFFEAFEGENRALASAAFRIPLIPVRYVDLGDQPQMMNLKFGLSLGFFIDTGTVWFQSEDIKDLKFQTGYGLGLHMHLPYIHVLRFEMAFNERGRKQFILDMGVDI
jgi:outer membrane protein assembly factor BamA